MIDPQVLGFVVFLLIALGVTAVGLLLRDMAALVLRRDGRRSTITLRSTPDYLSAERSPGLIASLDQQIYQLVQQSGLGWSGWSLLMLMACSALGAGGSVFFLTEDPLAGWFATIPGMLLPLPFVIIHRNRRMRKMQQQLPDALDLLSRAVSAGESLEQAIELVADKTASPLGYEFKHCAKQLDLGLSVPASVRAMARRVPLTEMKIFSATLSVYRQTGGHLASTLQRLATVIRDRLTYRRQLRATTAAGRFSATVVAMIGPILFTYMMLFQSEYFSKLISISIGQYLLATAVILELIGIFWITRLLRQQW